VASDFPASGAEILGLAILADSFISDYGICSADILREDAISVTSGDGIAALNCGLSQSAFWNGGCTARLPSSIFYLPSPTLLTRR